MSLTSHLWKLLSTMIANLADSPQWLHDVAAMTLEEIQQLPQLDDTETGELARPVLEERVVTAEYIEFLSRQLQVRYDEAHWCSLLTSRLEALRPHIGNSVLHVTFYCKPESVTIRLNAETKEIVHSEIV